MIFFYNNNNNKNKIYLYIIDLNISPFKYLDYLDHYVVKLFNNLVS